MVSRADALHLMDVDIGAALAAPPVRLRDAAPPNGSGVYLLSVNGEIVYVGEAKGSKGLRDRLLSKHLSGDDNHAIQRAFKEAFPDRLARREHIKDTVWAQWLVINDPRRVSAVEKTLIWILNPAWNKT